MMTLLTKPEIAERIALYQRYGEALDKYEALAAMLPKDAPDDMVIESAGFSNSVQDRLVFVITRAWGPLRAAALRDMQLEVDAAEAAVRAFEAGEDTSLVQDRDEWEGDRTPAVRAFEAGENVEPMHGMDHE